MWRLAAFSWYLSVGFTTGAWSFPPAVETFELDSAGRLEMRLTRPLGMPHIGGILLGSDMLCSYRRACELTNARSSGSIRRTLYGPSQRSYRAKSYRHCRGITSVELIASSCSQTYGKVVMRSMQAIRSGLAAPTSVTCFQSCSGRPHFTFISSLPVFSVVTASA